MAGAQELRERVRIVRTPVRALTLYVSLSKYLHSQERCLTHWKCSVNMYWNVYVVGSLMWVKNNSIYIEEEVELSSQLCDNNLGSSCLQAQYR